MSSSFLKEPPVVASPKTLLSIAVSVGGLAVFLIFGSLFLVSQPIGSTVRGYFYNLDRFRQFDSVSLPNDTLLYPRLDDSNNSRNTDSLIPWGKEIADSGKLDNGSVNSASEDVNDKSISGDTNENFNSQQGVAISLSSNRTVSKIEETVNQPATPDPTSLQDETVAKDSFSNDSKVIENAKPPFSHSPDNSTNWTGSVDSGCDLYHGKWVYDAVGPLYTNNSCPVITQMQNCQGNGRPDKEYENWRWKPAECDIPRFDPKKFLELMRGKTLAFIGDSVARNQMESMLCILWQVEVPINRGNKRMQRHYFRSTSTTIVRIWSSWLVQQTSEPFDFAPAGIVKLHLDKPDQGFMEYIPTFDVIVLSSGHWFAKQSVYILNDEIVGGQLWWPDKSHPLKVNNIDAFEISVETIITAMATYPNYTGLTIVRSFSPDHYEGGAWNTGGSCTGKIKPLSDGELVENGFTNIMHEKQVKGFNRGIKKQNNQSKLRLLDITEAFGYRHDGHPGPYRSPDPNKVTKRGPDGRPPPQDCLHWCMPGPVDTWNELVGEIIRREFEGSERI